MLKRFVVALLSLLFLAAVTAAPVQDAHDLTYPLTFTNDGSIRYEGFELGNVIQDEKGLFYGKLGRGNQGHISIEAIQDNGKVPFYLPDHPGFFWGQIAGWNVATVNRIPGFADLAYEKYLQATIEGFSLYESSYRDLQPYVDAMRAYASGPAKYNRSKHPSLDSYIRSNPPQAGSNESTVSAGTSLAELDTKQPVVQPEINSGGTSSMADRQTNSGPTEGESRPM